MIPDNTSADDIPASIAGVGLALASYPVAVERAFASRAKAVERTLATLRFFWKAPQTAAPDATGHRGFFYHFLDVTTGGRAWRSELSTIDTAVLIAGALTAAAYFDRDTGAEREVRELADSLYRRVDWQWAQNGGATVSHGWKPETGFLRYRWQGYNEALILYVLGLGSPTHPLPAKSYLAWTSTYRWKKLYGHELLYGAPLFMHQLSHVWIDFRGIQDAFMRRRALDYFENSRRATYVNQQYAIRNPKGFRDYGQHAWGITASNGPGPATRRVGGVHAALPWIRRSRRAERSRRWHAGAMGRRRIVAVCARDRASHPGALFEGVPEHDQRIRAGLQFQSDVSGSRVRTLGLDLERPLRARPGAGHPDDRELSFGADLASHAQLSVHR